MNTAAAYVNPARNCLGQIEAYAVLSAAGAVLARFPVVNGDRYLAQHRAEAHAETVNRPAAIAAAEAAAKPADDQAEAAPILTEETAAEYVRNWHRANGRTVKIHRVRWTELGFDVTAIIPGDDEFRADWSVWIEAGAIYGEW